MRAALAVSTSVRCVRAVRCSSGLGCLYEGLHLTALSGMYKVLDRFETATQLVCCRVTNPHDFEVDGVHFLGTAGQNVDDVYR